MTGTEAAATAAKAVVFAALALPATLLAHDYFNGRFASPYRTIVAVAGLWSMRVLVATLLLSPLAAFGLVAVNRFRRMFGLFAAFYAAIHVWAWFRLYGYEWALLWEEVTIRLYLILGVVGTVLLIPLVVTSTTAAKRALGEAGWRRLHVLIYPATILALLHFWLSRRGPPIELAVEAAITITILLWRTTSAFKPRGA